MINQKIIFVFVGAFLFGILEMNFAFSGEFFRGFMILIIAIFLIFEIKDHFGESMFKMLSVFLLACLLGALRYLYFSENFEVAGDSDFVLFKALFKLKTLFENRLMEIYPEPYGNFMAGLLTGSRAAIDKNLMDKFRETGLTHIVAISGYNISIIIILISGAFGFLGRKMKVIFSIIFVILFTIFVGASASVVRASIMGIISLVALKYGRQYYAKLGLMFAAFLMCLFSPKMLIEDLGFQLSVLATAGIIYISPLIKKHFEFLPEFFALRETLIMSVSAQVFVFPLILLKFGYFNLLSPLINVFILPFIPYAMLFGFLGVIISFASSFMGTVVGFFGYLSLKIVVFFVEFFAQFKMLTFEIYWFSWVVLVAYFLLFFKFYKSKLC